MREQLTYSAEPITVAAASPAPSGFAFLEDAGGDENAQVYYFPLANPGARRAEDSDRADGGGARLLTDGRSRHGGLVWSHDGKRLAFYGNERDPAIYDIYTVGVAAGTKPRLLVAGHDGLWRPLDWSPDGRTLLVEQTLSTAQNSLFLADATTGALTPLDPGDQGADIRMARFAPDGRGVYVVSEGDDGLGTLRRVDVVTHASRVIVGGASGSGRDARRPARAGDSGREEWTPRVRGDIDGFDVSADGRYIAYVVNEDGRSRLTLLDMTRKLALSPPGVPAGVIGTLRFDRTGRRLAFSAESAVMPRDVFVLDVERSAVVRWTRSEPGPVCAGAARDALPAMGHGAPHAGGPASATGIAAGSASASGGSGGSPDCPTFVPAELVHFPTWDRADGERRMLSAYLYRPRTAGRHPVLIMVHGGPQEQYRPRFDPFIQFLVNELGYAVVAPNVRGSSGYGKAFLELDNGRLREDAVRDVGSLLVWIDLQPELDRGRVAILGTGYGGYLALASLADYTDRLRGAIDVCGISDFVRFLEHTAVWRRDRQRTEYGDERDPRMRDFLSRISPIAKVKWLRRPLLVVQGLNDPRVPPSESTDLVASLRARGEDVWYLAASDEGHGFHRQQNRETYYEVAAMFLRRLATGPR
jgi:dipeptidyl aminopeptidase/acylaminoacyl peptidase